MIWIPSLHQESRQQEKRKAFDFFVSGVGEPSVWDAVKDLGYSVEDLAVLYREEPEHFVLVYRAVCNNLPT